MYLGDRCRFFDDYVKAWVRGEITDISILPAGAARCNADVGVEGLTEVFITVSTSHGDFMILGSDEHLNHIQFRITFSDAPRAKVA
jgi:hypothetical protein